LSQAGYEPTAPATHDVKRRKRLQRAFIEVKATGQLNLHGMNPLGGAAVVLRREAAGVGIVVSNRPTAA
jgi:hypothetical protein